MTSPLRGKDREMKYDHRFTIVDEGDMGCALVVDGETVLECMTPENLLDMTFAEVLHLIEEVSK